MSKFVLTAQLQLQAPTNVGQVVSQIQNQLNNVKVNVQVQGTQQAQQQVQALADTTNKASSAAAQLGKSFGLSIKRFAAFSIATRAVSLFTGSLSKAVDEAISFERQLIKISQVTGKSMSQLRELTDEINRLSTGLGVSSTSLLNVSTILSQAGLDARETKIALDALAKSDLAPTFDDIGQTAEGVVAIFNQFQQGAEALEAQLGAINAVAGRFAVEAGDLISVVRRTGGVFKAAGGDLNELIALFTSVRATTRESAESIATGLRTIFTRIQRPKTIEFLRRYGVELLDLEGKFVGPFEATKRLSEALAGLGEGDIRFVQIAEELGGFRQIGKVIPLLGQFKVAQEALNVAQAGSGSLADDAAKAQAALAVRITKVKEEFLSLVRSITETTAFQVMANTVLSLAESLIKLADALKPILPLLLTFAGIKLATGFGAFIKGIGGGLKTPRGFATGGLVPGSGNSDTVPAMLTPGEFVIRKSSVAKLGAGNLAAMNENRFANGSSGSGIKPGMRKAVVRPGMRQGVVGGRDVQDISFKQPEFSKKQSVGIATTSALEAARGNISLSRDEVLNQTVGGVGRSLNDIFDKKAVTYFNQIFPSGKSKGFSYPTVIEGVGKDEEAQFKNILDRGITQAVTSSAQNFAQEVLGVGKLNPIKILPSYYEAIDNAFRGQVFEQVLSATNGQPLRGSDSQRPYDFTRGIGKFKKVYSNLDMNYVDSRITAGSAGISSTQQTQESQKIFQKKSQAQLALELIPVMKLAQKKEQQAIKQSQGVQGASRTIPSSFIPGKEYQLSSLSKFGINNRQQALDAGFISENRGYWKAPVKKATGGEANGTDTVPALLTPGEFVVNKAAAQRIGYGSLNRMNKVAKYASGGAVGGFGKNVQRFRFGGEAAAKNISDSFNREGYELVGSMGEVRQIFEQFIGGLTTLPDTLKQTLGQVETFQLTKDVKLKTNAGEKTGDQLRGVSMGGKIGVNIGKAGTHTVKHEAAHEVDRSLGGGQMASRTEGTFQNKIAVELQKTMEKELGASAYRLDQAELFADALAKAPAEVQKILVSTTDAAEGSKKLAEYFNKAGGPVAGLADLSADEFGGTQMVQMQKPRKGDAVTPKSSQDTKGAIKSLAGNEDLGKQIGQLSGTIAKDKVALESMYQKSDSLTSKIAGYDATIAQLNSQAQAGAKGTTALNKIYELRAKTLQERDNVDKQVLDADEKLKQAIEEKTKLIQQAKSNKEAATQLVQESKQTTSLPPTTPTAPTSPVSPYGPSPLPYQEQPVLNKKAVIGGVSVGGVLGGVPGGVLNTSMQNATGAYQNTQQVVKTAKESLPAKIAQSGGGKVGGGGGGLKMDGMQLDALAGSIGLVTTGLLAMLPPLDENSSAFTKMAHGALSMVSAVGGVVVALGSMGFSLGGLTLGQAAAAAASFFMGTAGTAAGIATTALATSAGVAAASVGGLAGAALATASSMLFAIAPFVAAAVAVAGPFLLVAGAAVALSSAFNWVMGMFYDKSKELEEATKAGDVGKAESLAGQQADFEAANTARMVFGPAIGTLVANLAPEFTEGLNTLFGGNTRESAIAMAGANAAAARSAKSLEKANDKVSAAMKDFEAGTVSATDVIKASAQATKDANEFRKKADTAIAANEQNKSTVGNGAIARNIFTLGGLIGESAGERNKRIDEENKALGDQAKKAEQDAIQAAMPGIQVLSREVAATGGSFADFQEKLKATDPALAELLLRNGATEIKKTFENLAKEAEKTRKAFDAMNLGMQKVNAVSSALSVGLNNYLNAQEAGYSGLDNSIAVLEASVTNAAQGISDESFNVAIGSAVAGLEKLGASGPQIDKFKENITAVNTAQKFFAQASEETKNRLKAEFERGGAGGQSAEAKKDIFSKVITDQLAQSGIGEEVRNRISDAIAGADISNEDLTKIMEGDMSKLDEVLKKLGEDTLSQVIPALQELAKYEQQLAKMTQKKLELENRVVAAQQNLIDAQMEAADIIAKYGGPAVTGQQRADAIMQQANLAGDQVGVSRMSDGSASELNRRSGEIRQGLGEISAIRQAAAQGDANAQAQLEGESGVKLAEKEKRLQELAKSDYDTTKKLIAQKEEEIRVIGEKNKAEKAAIDSLLAGDIEKFFEQQAAVGATAAIALGDQNLMNAFGANAVGAAAQDIQRQQEAGVTELYGQQLQGAGGLTERAAMAGLNARGVGGAGAAAMAQVYAGTTGAEEAAKSDIRELAATLPNFAETQLQTAQQDLQTAEIQRQAAEQQLEAARLNVEQRAGAAGQPGGVATMAKGGMIYANRGIFVPRGTDTVPAMLTPGEFVVRREAVRRGNNLQLLQNMNRGQSGVSNSGSAVAMAGGGIVRYRANGSTGPEGGSGGGIGLSPEVVNNLATSLNKFNTDLSANIDKLNNTTFNVKLDSTNINVNLNGTSFLASMKDEIKSELFKEVGNQITSYRATDGGRLVKNAGVV